MKKVLIYGEFTPTSTTGIAYVNSNLEYSIKKISIIEQILGGLM